MFRFAGWFRSPASAISFYGTKTFFSQNFAARKTNPRGCVSRPSRPTRGDLHLSALCAFHSAATARNLTAPNLARTPDLEFSNTAIVMQLLSRVANDKHCDHGQLLYCPPARFTERQDLYSDNPSSHVILSVSLSIAKFDHRIPLPADARMQSKSRRDS